MPNITPEHLAYRASITLANSYQALSLAISLAPNGLVQQAISIEYNRLTFEGASPFVITQRMTDIIFDGLNSGNWPA
jgi:hypothetical protein